MTRVDGPLALAAILLLAVPSAAEAQNWFVGAGIGRATSTAVSASQRAYTGDLGWTSEHGWFGAEGDYGFVTALVNGVRSRTLSGSALIGKTIAGWRPYGSIGLGYVGEAPNLSDSFKFTSSSGVPQKNMLTLGGGIMGDFNRHLGARADVRVFRDLTSQTAGVPPHVTFTRISGGVYFRF